MKTPTVYQPAPSLAKLPEVFDRLLRDTFVLSPFERVFDGLRLNANLVETDEGYLVQLMIPGIKDVEKLQIQVVGAQLVVKGFTEIPTIENSHYIYRGLEGQEFSEAFTLPTEVDGEKALAQYELGILTITLPKAEFAKPRQVKVTTVH